MSAPIRVLHVLSSLNHGGAQSNIMNIYRNIDRTKIQFDFILHTKQNSSYTEEVRSLGGRIFSIEKYNGYNHFSYLESWRKFFRNNREYKIIHSHVRSTASLFLKIAKEHGLITIIHSHNTSNGKGIKALIKGILQFDLRSKTDYLFACSNLAGQWLFGKNVIKKSNYFVWKNAIETEKYLWNEKIRNEVRKSLGIPQNTKVFGHVGRFHQQKNHSFLIEVFKEIKNIEPNSKLLIVGDGELRCQIERKINMYNLSDSVLLTGIRNDIQEILQVMDVFIFPSIHEGLPVTLIEAQAAGLPCIVSDTITTEVAITDLVDFVSLQSTPNDWAEKALQACKKIRKGMYRDILDAGYDIKNVASEYEEFYFNIMQTKQLKES